MVSILFYKGLEAAEERFDKFCKWNHMTFEIKSEGENVKAIWALKVDVGVVIGDDLIEFFHLSALKW